VKLVIFSHKPIWRSKSSPAGFATDGGFPFQMAALSELFDETRLLVPMVSPVARIGELPLVGHNLCIVPLSPRWGAGFLSKLTFLPWLLWNGWTIMRELYIAEGVHAPIPGDVGTVGMLGAFLLRKPLFVRYCGNWLRPATTIGKFCRWFMEMIAGGRNVMLATGGSLSAPSSRTPNVQWVFSTSLKESEISALGTSQVEVDPEKLRLITVGRQETGKGTEILINALPLISQHYPRAVLEVVGDGSQLPFLKRQADELGVSNKVTFHGKLDHAGVLRLMGKAHIFTFPTRSEGFPKVVLEALACGLPVIATPVSVLPTLLSGGCGILIQPDPASIATAVCDLASSPGRYKLMSAKARETAREYTIERWRDTIGGYLSAAWGPLGSKEDRG
jgi:glycosyltransferase involved in cell wall biosynthesis